MNKRNTDFLHLLSCAGSVGDADIRLQISGQKDT